MAAATIIAVVVVVVVVPPPTATPVAPLHIQNHMAVVVQTGGGLWEQNHPAIGNAVIQVAEEGKTLQAAVTAAAGAGSRTAVTAAAAGVGSGCIPTTSPRRLGGGEVVLLA